MRRILSSLLCYMCLVDCTMILTAPDQAIAGQATPVTWILNSQDPTNFHLETALVGHFGKATATKTASTTEGQGSATPSASATLSSGPVTAGQGVVVFAQAGIFIVGAFKNQSTTHSSPLALSQPVVVSDAPGKHVVATSSSVVFSPKRVSSTSSGGGLSITAATSITTATSIATATSITTMTSSTTSSLSHTTSLNSSPQTIGPASSPVTSSIPSDAGSPLANEASHSNTRSRVGIAIGVSLATLLLLLLGVVFCLRRRRRIMEESHITPFEPAFISHIYSAPSNIYSIPRDVAYDDGESLSGTDTLQDEGQVTSKRAQIQTATERNRSVAPPAYTSEIGH
ncbi:hypothetical protein C8J56DRAFT_1171940 [Mycena floridula]|nr:hypothetical protein C8J56DRAFT_1171940 [Mycena floridula]